MTAAAAVKGIREVDSSGSIGILSAEPHKPYKRPPLTKKLWQGKPENMIWLDPPAGSLDYHLGCRVVHLDPARKRVQDQAGEEYTYRHLLLATGGTPRRFPFGGEEILYYRTIDDYRTVRSWTGKGARIGIIGGGFIGSELAAALASLGERVTMAFPGAGISDTVFPGDLSSSVTEYFRQKGVDVRPGIEIQGVERQGDQLAMKAKDGQTILVDHVIAGIGIRPNTELAQAAGIEIAGSEAGGGILVDEHLQTNQPDIFAAGDVAAFYNPSLQRRMRVEHEDNANTMGYFAGLNLAGRLAPYDHQPYFYSDLFDLGYEAVGELNPGLETFADWREPFREGVVYYLKDQKVRGVLLWNTWGQVDAARRLIAEGSSFEKSELKGRLPESG